MMNTDSEACRMFFMVLLPRQDPIFGFEGLSKTVDMPSWRNNYVPKTTPVDSESKPFTPTRCILPVGSVHSIATYVEFSFTSVWIPETRKNNNTARTT